MKKHLGRDTQILISEWKQGVYAIDEHLFNVVGAFTKVMSVLIKAIPIGLNKEEDKMYSQERREDLLESTLVVFHRANELLNCSHITPGMEEESKDWDVMRKPSNDVLESLFK